MVITTHAKTNDVGNLIFIFFPFRTLKLSAEVCVLGTKLPVSNEVGLNEWLALAWFILRRYPFIISHQHSFLFFLHNRRAGFVKSSRPGRPSPGSVSSAGTVICGYAERRQAWPYRNRMPVYAPVRPDKSLRDSRRPGAPRRRHRLYLPCRFNKSISLANCGLDGRTINRCYTDVRITP